jgi:hypothetical protein
VAVVCAVRQIDEMSRLFFSETTTIGLRYTLAARKTLRREIRKVQTSVGTVNVKVSFLEGRRINFAPEYEDCRKLAEQKGMPLKEVIAEAASAFLHAEGAG